MPRPATARPVTQLGEAAVANASDGQSGTDLNFIHLGVPRVHGWKGYIYQTPNLVRMPHEVPQEGPPTEDTEADPVMALKEELKRWRRDNGQE
jgi:hypothetical protein